MEALDIWDVAFPERPENFRKEDVCFAGGRGAWEAWHVFIFEIGARGGVDLDEK